MLANHSRNFLKWHQYLSAHHLQMASCLTQGHYLSLQGVLPLFFGHIKTFCCFSNKCLCRTSDFLLLVYFPPKYPGSLLCLIQYSDCVSVPFLDHPVQNSSLINLSLFPLFFLLCYILLAIVSSPPNISWTPWEHGFCSFHCCYLHP
jgi:hypothetical protein